MLALHHVTAHAPTHPYVVPAWEALDGTDMGAVHEGFVSVTPLHLDLTHHGMLSQMGDWSAALTAQYRRRTSPRAGPVRRRRAR